MLSKHFFSSACITFVKQAQQATTVLHELDAFIRAKRVDEACSPHLRAGQCKVESGEEQVIEANKERKAEGFMKELVLEEEQAKKDKQARQDAKAASKSSSKGQKAVEAADHCPTCCCCCPI